VRAAGARLVKIVLAILGLSLLQIPAVPPMGGPLPTEQRPVFKSSASLVALNVTVVDQQQRFVGGLSADDFEVFEDGVRQDVRFFETRQTPIDLIVLIDSSSSMRPRMQMAHEAALGFVRTLRAGDRGAVITFDDTVDVVQPLTSDHAQLASAIRSTSARGGTALHNALYIALKQFGRPARGGTEVRRQALAVLSDGDDTSSLISFEDVQEVARRTGVSIYPISLTGTPADHDGQGRSEAFSKSQFAMRQLARDTGAQAFFPQNIHELDGIYGSIARELASQYSIGYSPSNASADGRFRRILVKVLSRPDCRLRARAGYIAEATAGAAGHGPDFR
jgi:Ca-activated chloride channel family protein